MNHFTVFTATGVWNSKHDRSSRLLLHVLNEDSFLINISLRKVCELTILHLNFVQLYLTTVNYDAYILYQVRFLPAGNAS